jgi:DNA helicase-2/ATP-dependent DNA helicase PcrA
MSIDFEHELNDEQRTAALAPDGPVLVIAAAGTGKTRTLTYRVAHLVDRGIQPDRILLLTFTNRAAREMLDRARALVGEQVGGVWGGTFHHFAHRILRRWSERVGLPPGFTIVDEEDATTLMRRAVAQLRQAHPHLPKPEVLREAISNARNRGEDPADALSNTYGELLPRAVLEEAVRLYSEAKRAANAVDFDDLLELALQLLEQHPDVRSRYQEQFLHVLVDEYQDTNDVQARLVDLVAARHRNLLVVGDDFQSIYAWRGANYRNFLSFPTRYPDTKVFRLETNYRSVPGILEVANVCIAGNPEQFQKTLRPVRRGGGRPICVDLFDGDEQARFVVQALHELRTQGYAWRDMAVLYRAHYHAMELQVYLNQARIPYMVTSGPRFFEQAHIKDLLAVLRLVREPTDELAFLRLLQLFPRIGERTARSIWQKLGGRWSPLREDDRQAILRLIPAAAHEDLQTALEALGKVSAPQGRAIAEAWVAGFYRHYAMQSFTDADRRLDDIEAMAAFMDRYPTLGEFLAEVALLTNVDTTEGPMALTERGDRVLLTTVHQAKGLEWPVVVVLWLVEGMFPSARALELNLPEGLAEERRLFYVATTRAKDHLILCVPRSRSKPGSGRHWCQPSRFVTEIPAQLLEHLRLRW